jgi:uncharacterized membrane protein
VEESQTVRQRERDLDRFLTFIDAIVAIAITLLVLPLVELPAHADDYGSVGALLRDHQSDIWAFLLSFVVVSRFWFAQHHAVRHLVGYHGRVAGLLMLWALTIVFLPFPTGLVADEGGSATTKVLYIGTMVATTALIGAVQAVLARRTELTDGTEHADPTGAVANALMLVLALAVTLAIPATSYYPLLLLLAADPVADRWRRWRAASMRSS